MWWWVQLYDEFFSNLSISCGQNMQLFIIIINPGREMIT